MYVRTQETGVAVYCAAAAAARVCETHACTTFDPLHTHLTSNRLESMNREMSNLIQEASKTHVYQGGILRISTSCQNSLF